MMSDTLPRYEMFSMNKEKIVLKKHSWKRLISETNEYVKVNAYNTAILAKIAYDNNEDISSFFKNEYIKGKIKYPQFKNPFIHKEDYRCSFNPDNYRFFDYKHSTNTQLFVISSNNQIIISYRGTLELEDWVQNIKAKQVDFIEAPSCGKVHKGFYEAFKSAKNDVDNYIKDLKLCTDTEIICVGHSLGGAVATLHAAYLRETTDYNVSLYTFGQPRTCDSSFANYFSTIKPINYFRFVNDKDIIPMLPTPGTDLKPSLLPLGLSGGIWSPAVFILSYKDLDNDPFSHFGKLIHIEEFPDKTALVLNASETYNYCKVKLKKDINLYKQVKIEDVADQLPSISDHYINNYIKYIRYDMIRTIRSYLIAPDNSITENNKKLILLEKEIDDLKENRNNMLDQAENHLQLSKETKEDYLKAFHKKEYSDLKYKASKIQTVLADKKFNLTNLERHIDYHTCPN